MDEEEVAKRALLWGDESHFGIFGGRTHTVSCGHHQIATFCPPHDAPKSWRDRYLVAHFYDQTGMIGGAFYFDDLAEFRRAVIDVAKFYLFDRTLPLASVYRFADVAKHIEDDRKREEATTRAYAARKRLPSPKRQSTKKRIRA